MKVVVSLAVVLMGLLAGIYAPGVRARDRQVETPFVRTPAAVLLSPMPSLTPPLGNVYYVAPDGNDSNPGTESLPWQSIGRAASSLGPGDTVFIKSGTYRERVVPRQSGTPNAYITYAAHPGHTVVIDGEGFGISNFEGLVDLSQRRNIRVQGLTVRNSSGVAIFATEAEQLIVEGNHTLNSGSSGIGMWYSRSIVVAGNDVENSGSNGANESISLGGVDGFDVHDNHVHNEAPGYHKEGIDVKEGSSNGRIFRNDVHHTRSVGIYVDAYNRHTFNIDVFENAVHDTEASGFALASEAGGLLEDVRLYSNLSYNNEHCGIAVWGEVETGPHPMKDIQILNNTVFRNGWGGCGVGIKVSNPDARGVVVRGNILGENTPLQLQVGAALPPGELTMEQNLIETYPGRPKGQQGALTDPWYWDQSRGGFWLRSDAPGVE